MPKLALIGGNPKGYNQPFHPDTLSGRRLRNILTDLKLHCKIVDMTKNFDDIPTEAEIEDLQKQLQGYKVIFLGRFVERQLKKHFPNGVYLPHPASRRKSDIIRLKQGLEFLVPNGK